MNIIANPATHDCRGCELFQLHTPVVLAAAFHVLETLQKNADNLVLILSRLSSPSRARVRNNEMLKRSVREMASRLVPPTSARLDPASRSS